MPSVAFVSAVAVPFGDGCPPKSFENCQISFASALVTEATTQRTPMNADERPKVKVRHFGAVCLWRADCCSRSMAPSLCQLLVSADGFVAVALFANSSARYASGDQPPRVNMLLLAAA